MYWAEKREREREREREKKKCYTDIDSYTFSVFVLSI
jgi:hypothetical protein